MNTSYDELTITISADSSNANKTIKGLSSSLKALDKTAQDLDTKRLLEIKGLLQDIANLDFSNVSKGMQDIASVLKKFSTKALEITSPTFNWDKSSAFSDTENVANIEVPKLEEVKGALAIWVEYRNELEKLKKTANEFSLDLRKMSDNFTKIKAPIIDVASALDTATYPLEKLGHDLSSVGINLAQWKALLGAINYETNKFTPQQINLVREALIDMGKGAEEVERIIARLSMDLDSELKPNLDDVARSMQALGLNGTQVKAVLSSINYETNTFTSEQIKQVEKTLLSMGYSAEETKDYISRLSKETATLNKTAKKSSKDGIASLLVSFSRILKYRIIRKIIQDIYQSLTQGVKNIVQFDEATANSFAEIQASLGFVTDSLGSMLAPLIQMLQPMISTLADVFGTLANTLGEVFARINGQTVFAQATKDVEKYRNELKKTKSQTLGIDELNIFSQENNGSFEMVDLDNVKKADNIFKDIVGEINELVDKLKPIIESLQPIFEDVFVIVKDIFETTIGALTDLFEDIDLKAVLTPIMDIIKIVVGLVNNLVNSTKGAVNDSVAKLLEMVTSILETVSTIVGVLSPILDAVNNSAGMDLKSIAQSLGIIAKATALINKIIEPIFHILEPIFQIVEMIMDAIGGILNGALQIINGILTTIIDTFGAIWKTMVALFQGNVDEIANIWGDLGKDLIGVWADVGNFFIDVINTIIFAFQDFLNWFVDKASIVANWFGVDTSSWGVNFSGIEKISYATGGFPEDGLFFANHNELVGTFSNGQTAVANNEQITEGIYQAVLQAMRESGNKGDIILNVDGHELARIVTQEQDNFGSSIMSGGKVIYGK